MSMLKNWEKTSISDEMRYYTENESGRFYCDEKGLLTNFEPAENNRLYLGPFGFNRIGKIQHLQKLIIPEGIRIIEDPKWPTREIIIMELVLPSTLEKLGEHVLSNCLLTEVELPASLREIGPGALMCDYIHVLRIPQGMQHPKYPVWGQKKAEGALTVHGRQFKETIINTLIVPKEYPYKELMLETKINNIVYSD